MTSPETFPLSGQGDVLHVDATPDGVVTITLHRPARRNALDGALLAALTDVFETLRGDPDQARVVFVRGSGGAFCSGADLRWMTRPSADNHQDALAVAHMLRLARQLPQLTAALVHGPAYGSGGALCAACDIAIATQDARFGFPEVRNGFVPGMISPYIIEAVGARNARGLFASAREVDAGDALRLGLVTELVSDVAGLEAAKARLAAEALACEPQAVAGAKRLVDELAGRPIDRALEEETVRRTAAYLASAEGREGLQSFLARRKPSWAR